MKLANTKTVGSFSKRVWSDWWNFFFFLFIESGAGADIYRAIEFILINKANVTCVVKTSNENGYGQTLYELLFTASYIIIIIIHKYIAQFYTRQSSAPVEDN